MSNRIRILLITVSSIVVLYILVGGLLGKSDTASSSNTTNEKSYRDLGVYQEVLDRIKSDYVTDPNLGKVTDGAIHGMLEALDPYSTYLSPADYKSYQEHPDGGPASVGLFVSKRGGFAAVVSVLPGGPADKAGVKPGDLLDRVEETPTRDFSAVQLDRMLAGQSGSKVSVTVVRESRGGPEKLEMTRAVIQYPPLVAQMLPDGTGYLRVPSFNGGRADEIKSKLQTLVSQGATKIVLDLRNCAGGEVPEAISTASLFIDKGLVAYLAGQRYPRQNLDAKPAGDVCKLPLAVLINQSTAGPAELVAAAVSEDKRGQAVGTRSFGVGVYQQVVQVGDGSALLLSVAKYYGPNGKAIQDNGVNPDVLQAPRTDSSDDDNPESPQKFGGKDDLQLQKAIEVLKQGSASKAALVATPLRPAA